MGINIRYKSLTFEPGIFIRGEEVDATISYTVLVDVEGDNPVKFTLEVPQDSPFYFIADGVKKKKTTWQENINEGDYQTYQKEITVGVRPASGPITSVFATITGKTNNNETSADSRVIRHKNG